MIQRICKGFLTSKRFFKVRSKFKISKQLDKFMVLRKDIEFQLAHLLWYCWKVYKGRKARLAREEEERKAAAKARKSKKKKGRGGSFSTKNVAKASFSKKKKLAAQAT